MPCNKNDKSYHYEIVNFRDILLLVDPWARMWTLLLRQLYRCSPSPNCMFFRFFGTGASDSAPNGNRSHLEMLLEKTILSWDILRDVGGYNNEWMWKNGGSIRFSTLLPSTWNTNSPLTVISCSLQNLKFACKRWLQ